MQPLHSIIVKPNAANTSVFYNGGAFNSPISHIIHGMPNLLYIPRLATAYCLHILDRRAKRKPYIIFNSYKNQTFNFNSKYLFEYMHRRSYPCYFIVNDDEERSKLRKTYGKAIISTHSIRYLRFILNAPVWITSTAPPVRLPGVSRNRFIINLWHGIPLKTVGVLDKDCPQYRKFLVKWLYAKNTDVFCVTSEKLIRPISDSFLMPTEKIRPIGHPQSEAVLSNLVGDRNSSGEPFKVIYCPTYRNDNPVRLFPFDDFGLKAFDSFLEKHNIEVILKMHHCDENTLRRTLTPRIKQFNLDDDIVESLPLYDAMITDYSSLFFDFLLLDRPIIFLPYDLSEYEETRGMYFNYESVTPGAKPDTSRAFETAILHAKTNHNMYAVSRLKIKQQFYTHLGNPNENIIKLIRASDAWMEAK